MTLPSIVTPLVLSFTRAVNFTRLVTLTVAWVCAVLEIFFGTLSATVLLVGLLAFALFVLLTVTRLRWDSLVILSLLAVVMWLLLEEMPTFADIMAGGERVLIFAALLPTMALVRATAMTMPTVHATQDRLAALPLQSSAGGLQLAAHAFGGIINTGALALLSASLPDNATDDRRRRVAEAVIRGMVVSSAWSPFFVAFAIGQIFVAPIYAWMAIAIGVVSALLFTMATLVGLNNGFATSQLHSSLRCLSPVASRLFITLLAVLTVALTFQLTALSAVVVVMPVLVMIQMARHRNKAGTILRQTSRAMQGTADDLIIISAAMLVAFLATQDGTLSHLISQYYPGVIPGWVALMATPMLMMALSVVGIHPVITSTALLATFSAGGADVHPALLVQAHLIGWGAGTMSSVASLSVLTSASLFRVPTARLVFGDNMLCGFLYALIGGGLLVCGNLALGYS